MSEPRYNKNRSRGRGGRRQHQRPENPNFAPNWDNRIENFDDMELNAELTHGIYSYGFKQPSEIQSLAIKPIIDKRDVIAQAQSGTGKTGAFSIGVLNNVDIKKRATQALLLSPTRELAGQTFDFMKEIGQKMKDLNIQLFRGGNSVSDDQESASRFPHIVIATPGRAADLIKSGHLRCENLTMIVLDEADEMLSEGFIEQVKEIFQFLNPEIQILLFSATIPPEIFEIMDQFMKDPVKILVKAEKLTLEGIRQFYVNVGESTNKLGTLLDLYQVIAIQKAVIFSNTRETVDFLKAELQARGYPVEAIHSGLTQKDRDVIMRKFRLGTLRVVVATDLLARGIDIQQITLVINFEMPDKSGKENYLHRIGRSGRYGRKGVAINIVDKREMYQINDLTKYYHTKIDELPSEIGEIVQEANNAN